MERRRLAGMKPASLCHPIRQSNKPYTKFSCLFVGFVVKKFFLDGFYLTFADDVAVVIDQCIDPGCSGGNPGLQAEFVPDGSHRELF